MKNAHKHAEDLKSLCRKLIREHKPQERSEQEPLIALVRGAMSFDVSDSRAADAIKAIEKEFVDLNELRVATDLEIQEMLGQRYPEIERRVRMITGSLNNIFEREHTMNLERLKTISKRDARQFLREIPELHPFAEAYTMLYAFDAPCFPMDSETLAFLNEEDIMEEGTSLHDAQKFVEQHVKADDLYDLFAALRRAVYEDGKRKKRR